ncbi:hypothetical protein BDE02_08G194900 [Populus trichocarpa]|nr:hypothetical protein BDE02_08G194900 [Populus trichocarpa]
MADALVSKVLQQLTSAIENESALILGGKKKVEKLTTTLTAIRSVLIDAEKKQVKEKRVRVWLEQLEAISYDLDDLLDEWNTKICEPKRIEIMGHHHSSLSKKMVRLSKFLSPCFCVNQLVMHRDIGSKMECIKERLDEVANEKDKYHFNLDGKTEEAERQETTPLIDVSEVCGRDFDKDTIISKLCEEFEEENCPLIVSIAGMGGMGKTTLAQLVFSDDKVTAHFEHRIWVCVSEPFDRIRIAKTIINALDELRTCLWWQDWQEHLCKSVMGKKFLLVLDDVWTDDLEIWEPIKVPLKSGAQGSRILVTTRNEGVSKMMDAAYMLPLGKLSPEDSWSLFSKFAFYGKSREDRDNLEEIGREIADKCQGLPLAVKSLGSLMRFKETKQAWENVLHSDLWELEEAERGIFPHLLLSYHDLPSPIKRCFAFCAIFPRDHKIERDTLIQLWMAQGFLVPKGSVEMEQIGAEYFDNLVMRSFFQDLERDKDFSIVACRMHDIVQSFAQFLSKNQCFVIEFDEKNVFELPSLHTKARHMTLMGRKKQFHPIIFNLKNLRTLQVLQKDMETAPPDLFHGMQCLRGLDLSHTSITGLPSAVGRLFHLRWLNLSGLNFVVLPDTICKLYNLLALKLHGCRRLHRLPRGLGKLSNLRYLNIEETESLSVLPQGIGRLSNLRTLSKFCIGENGEGCNVGELKNLNRLRGHLEISGVEKVRDVNEVMEANLKNKEYLRSLDLAFSFGRQELITDVLEALQPHPNLEALLVYDYGGSILPSWMTLLTKMKDLKLLRCVNCKELPPLGKLPSLEKLLIGHFNNVKCVSVEFLGIDPVTDQNSVTESIDLFPKLKELTFRYMVEWENWDTTTITSAATRRTMPCLRSLSLYDCPKLKAIPEDLKQRPLEELIITRCPILEQQ